MGFPAAPPELTVRPSRAVIAKRSQPCLACVASPERAWAPSAQVTAAVQHPWVDPATRRVDYSSCAPCLNFACAI